MMQVIAGLGAYVHVIDQRLCAGLAVNPKLPAAGVAGTVGTIGAHVIGIADAYLGVCQLFGKCKNAAGNLANVSSVGRPIGRGVSNSADAGRERDIAGAA